MPDVLLSYSRDDQATARRYAEALAREGFEVWWDQSLRLGENCEQVTEDALRQARAARRSSRNPRHGGRTDHRIE